MRRLRGWVTTGWLWGAAATAMAVAASVAAATEAATGRVALPPASDVAVFAALAFWVENAAVRLSATTTATPSDLVVVAAVVAFGGSGASRAGVVLASGLVGLAGGIAVDSIRSRRLDALVANTAMHALSGVAAAAVFVRITRGSHLVWLLAAGLAAAVASVVVNITGAIAFAITRRAQPFGAVWSDVRTVLPSSIAFGMLGILSGWLYTMGPLALGLLVAPLTVGRWTYASYLRLREGYEAALGVFVNAIDAKDRYTAGHSARVARFAGYIGEELGFTSTDLERLRIAALLHDIGKLAVPSRLLNKPGRLTPEEYEQVQLHNRAAMQILGRVDFLRDAIPVASDRHAHFDRDTDRDDPWAMTGYAVAVADAFDAMTSTRAYRRALPQDVAFAELRDKAGTQFHPACVDALIRAVERRGERYGAGHERDVVDFAVPPPEAGVGSAGLGDLLPSPDGAAAQ